MAFHMPPRRDLRIRHTTVVAYESIHHLLFSRDCAASASFRGPVGTLTLSAVLNLSCTDYLCGPTRSHGFLIHYCPAVTLPDMEKMGMYSARRTTRTMPPTRTIIAGSRKLIIVITVVSTFFS